MLKILGRKNSSNVQKVLWACDELELPYEREDIGGPFGGNQEPDYLAMNPNGHVPTLVDEGTVLWESNVIVRYLCDKHAPNSLRPEDRVKRALADQWMDWQQTTAGPAMFPVFWGLVRTAPEDRDLEAIADGRDRLEATLSVLDDHLSRSDYVASESFSMGDIPLGIITYRWFNLDIERKDLPNLGRWFENLTQRPAFQHNIMNWSELSPEAGPATRPSQSSHG